MSGGITLKCPVLCEMTQQPGARKRDAIAAVRQELAEAVRAGNGGMFAAGQWRWGITGSRGTIVISARSAWPHRKLRARIRAATGVTVPAEAPVNDLLQDPDPAALDPRELYGVLVRAADRAHPLLRNLKTSRWEMGLDWYLAFRRASLPPELPEDDEARDESKWVPDPEDMVLGYRITVTPGGGMPHLVSDEELRTRSFRAEELHS